MKITPWTMLGFILWTLGFMLFGQWGGYVTAKAEVTSGRVHVHHDIILPEYRGEYMCLKIHKPEKETQ